MGQGGYDDGDDYSILDYYGSFGNDKKSQVYASGTSIHDCGESVDMTVGMACDEDEDNWGGFDMPHEGLDDGMAMVAPLKLAPTIKHESTQRQPKRSKPKHKSVKSIAEKEFVTGLAPRPIARDEQEQYVRALLGADVRERAEKEEAERVEAARQLEMDRQRELERLQERELQQQRVREQAVELQARQPGRRSLVEMERQPERGAFERDEWPSVKHNNGHTRGAASENAIANVLLGGNSLAVVAAAESGHVEVTNPNFRFRSLEERRTDRGSTGTSRSGSSSSTSRRSADKKNRLDNLMKLF